VGFSVSGSFAIIVVAAFIAFGMAYTAGANGFERVTEATKDTHESGLDAQNTAVDIVRANYSAGQLEVNVTNNGTTALAVDATDVIVDGTFHTHDEFDALLVDGEPNTAVWLPGEELTVRIDLPGLGSSPRVKVVTEHGVADAVVVG